MPKLDLNQLEYEYNLELKEAVQECLNKDPDNLELQQQLNEINEELENFKIKCPKYSTQIHDL